MEQFVHTALRWDTRRSKVAAALLVYGFKLCEEQPFIRMRDPDGKQTDGVSIWFNPNHPRPDIIGREGPEPGIGEADSRPHRDCGWFELQWIHKDRWANFVAHCEHGRPWAFMRAGMEAREYLLGNVVRGGRDEPAPPDAFRTENLTLASCLCALRFHVYAHKGGVFTFNAKARDLIPAFENDSTAHVIRWPKFALIQLDILTAAIRSPENIPQFGFKVANKVAILPENSPPRIRDPLIRHLHA